MPNDNKLTFRFKIVLPVRKKMTVTELQSNFLLLGKAIYLMQF